MAGQEHVFKVVVADDYTYKIELGGYEKLATLDKLAELARTQEQMGNWLESDAATAEQKEQYGPMYLNLLATLNDVWQLLKRAGATEAELKEHMEIPF